MKKRLTIILKSSISGAELGFGETKNVTCETKIDELPKHETTRSFLLTSFPVSPRWRGPNVKFSMAKLSSPSKVKNRDNN